MRIARILAITCQPFVPAAKKPGQRPGMKLRFDRRQNLPEGTADTAAREEESAAVEIQPPLMSAASRFIAMQHASHESCVSCTLLMAQPKRRRIFSPDFRHQSLQRL
ncbi:hypothetical protein [Microvirga zambiensis]|uniref:hypothetical protein n=1 Tax=Microvirga zambiensis TaxID=1402137 RepID=UPI00191E12E0|nr:hypothetical protein [Microvirga zambiensis]